MDPPPLKKRLLRDSVLSRYPNTENWLEKNEARDETLFRYFDMASRTIHNSWRNIKQNFAVLRLLKEKVTPETVYFLKSPIKR